MNNYIRHLPNCELFNQLREYGLEHLGEHKVNDLMNISNDTHVITHRMVPKFNYPIPIDWVQVFCITANSIGKTHKDGIDRQCALNIPLLYCDKGIMEWFNDDFNMQTFDNDYTRVRLVKEEIGAVDFRIKNVPDFSTTVTVPSVVSTNHWHRMNNIDNPHNRYMLSIRFKGNPSFTNVFNAFLLNN